MRLAAAVGKLIVGTHEVCYGRLPLQFIRHAVQWLSSPKFVMHDPYTELRNLLKLLHSSHAGQIEVRCLFKALTYTRRAQAAHASQRNTRTLHYLFQKEGGALTFPLRLMPSTALCMSACSGCRCCQAGTSVLLHFQLRQNTSAQPTF